MFYKQRFRERRSAKAYKKNERNNENKVKEVNQGKSKLLIKCQIKNFQLFESSENECWVSNKQQES